MYCNVSNYLDIFTVLLSSLTVGQPVRGTIQMKCEIRLPLKEIEDGKEYNWPTIIQEKRYVRE